MGGSEDDRRPEWMVDQIDPAEGRPQGPSRSDRATPRAPTREPEPPPVRASELPLRRDYYPPPSGFRRELRKARDAYDRLERATRQIFVTMRVGQHVDVAPLRGPIRRMIASILRHPDALTWMTRLQNPDNYLTAHAVRSAILAAVLGRYMGLAEARLELLVTGTLLCQIGKTKLPRSLLDKREPLSPQEFDRVREHVSIGARLLEKCDGVYADAVEIVENHQERFDGSGYPRGLIGDEIPPLARIAGLVHCFDAMTSLRVYTDRIMSTAEDLDYLYQQRDVLFQGQLVEALIQALGIYPTGSMVELNGGAVALVESQNPQNRTQPRIILVSDPQGQPLKRLHSVDIRDYNSKEPDRPLTIRRGLTAGEFPFDPVELMERYLAPPWKFWGR